jgi:hypothetical protein
MTSLIRLQAATLLRSYRWIFPLIAYALLIAVGAGGSTSLAQTLDWSGAMLVPVVAFLTRSMLTATPDAARACVSAAAGPVRAHLAALAVTLGAGVVLGLAATLAGVMLAEPASDSGGSASKVTAAAHHPGIVAGGLLIALVCVGVGSAAGTLCNPPLLRHPAVSRLSTLAAIVAGLAVGVSPANAAVSHTTAQSVSPVAANWPGPASVAGSVILLAVAWGVSAAAAARRDTWSASET